jgi:uronate dehydrogenase
MTGAAGRMGSMLRPRLKQPGRTIRLLDVAPIDELDEGEEFIQATVTDRNAVYRACQGVEAIIHMGGILGEADWDSIMNVNIDGTRTVFEAARQAGVKRVIFASSNHAIGFFPQAGGFAPDYAYPRPDSYYGVAKVVGEALGSMYADRYGMDVTCIRIMTCHTEPSTKRMLASWLSPDDAGRVVEACLTTDETGFHIIYGVSANTRAWYSQEEARKLGYFAADNAETLYGEKLGDGPREYNDLVYIGAYFTGSNYDSHEDFSQLPSAPDART